MIRTVSRHSCRRTPYGVTYTRTLHDCEDIEMDFDNDRNMTRITRFLSSMTPWTRVESLDLSRTAIDRLPDLATMFPNLRTLRCVATKIRFINTDFPATLKFAMFDDTPLAHVSKRHVLSNGYVSATLCPQLRTVPLSECRSRCGDKWYLVQPPRLAVDQTTLEHAAARIIQRFVRRHVYR